VPEDNAARDPRSDGRSEPTTVGELAEALVMDSGALAHTLNRWSATVSSLSQSIRRRRNR